MLLGALEAGGTKMVMSTGDENGNIIERVSIPTRTPSETMPEMIAFFRGKAIKALGVGSFGPVNLDPDSPRYGYITTTPKLPWQFYPLRSELEAALGIPVGFDTDVNVAAIGESELGAGRGKKSLLYVTIGTGIGGGVILDNKPLHGAMHPELGHIILSAHPDDPMPQGSCPFHRGCLEGLASGPSIEARWGISARDLPDDHFGWELEAYYLGQLCADAIYMYSPHIIVLGGGVMHKAFLFDRLRSYTQEFLHGYIAMDQVKEGIADYIVPPALGDNAGATGALLLARKALEN